MNVHLFILRVSDQPERCQQISACEYDCSEMNIEKFAVSSSIKINFPYHVFDQ